MEKFAGILVPILALAATAASVAIARFNRILRARKQKPLWDPRGCNDVLSSAGFGRQQLSFDS